MTEPFNPQVEQWRNDVDVWKARHQHDLDWTLESFKGVLQFSLAAIRGIILVNGGAAIAILAFLGNVWSKDPSTHAAASSLVWPLRCFLGGIAAGLATAAAAYVAQTAFGRRWNGIGVGFQIAGMLFALVGLVAFIAGSLGAADVFTRFGS